MSNCELLESRLLMAAAPTNIKITLLQDIAKGADTGFGGSAFVFEGKLYFVGVNGKGAEIWKSDGTKEGTELLKNINGEGSAGPNTFAVAKGQFYFSADDGENGREPWVSDGTRGGTRVIDVFPGSIGSGPVEFVTVGKRLLFAASPGSTGKLLVSGGNSFSQVQVPEGEDVGNPLGGAAGKFFFSFNTGKDGTTSNDDNIELWTCDPDGSNAEQLKNLAKGKGFSAYPNDAVVAGDLLFFTAYTGTNPIDGRDLCVSNGTAAGTKLLRNFGSLNVSYGAKVAQGDDLYFGIRYQNGDQSLWVSDGQPDGTELIANVNDSNQSGSINHIAKVKGKVFFNAATADGGDELWVIDQPGADARLVKPKGINPGAASSSPRNFAKVGKWLYFTATNVKNGQELWRTDGTKEHTKVLTDDLNPGTASSFVDSVFAANKTLFFSASTAAKGFELFGLTTNEPAELRVAAPSSDATFSRVPVAATSTGIFDHGDDDGDDTEETEEIRMG